VNAQHGRGRSSGSDLGGRLFLALISLVFIVAGLMKSGKWECFPLLVLGFIAGVLVAFHSRIQRVKIFDKLDMALIPQSSPEQGPRPRPEPTSIRENASRPPSIAEIETAARNPASRRRRS
jgi:hypothetical protein